MIKQTITCDAPGCGKVLASAPPAIVARGQVLHACSTRHAAQLLRACAAKADADADAEEKKAAEEKVKAEAAAKQKQAAASAPTIHAGVAAMTQR